MEDNFFERVYRIVRQIPEGKVTSYGAIAKALGTARSARMVGWAMNASHNTEDVPAHRVVNRKICQSDMRSQHKILALQHAGNTAEVIFVSATGVWGGHT